MKIRFIEPGNRPYRKSLLNYFVYDHTIRTPSVGLNTLATVCRRHFEDVRMYSESISKIVWKDVLDADFVFLSIFTFAAPRGYLLADYIRSHSRAIVVIGGLHATLNYPEACSHADYVLLGEGEESIVRLIEAVSTGRAIDFPGVAWQNEDGEAVNTGEGCPPADIDIIPDRDLVWNYRKMVSHCTIWPQVHASRGCPHNCDYCALVRLFGHRLRTRSPENVVADIRYSIDFFHSRPRMVRTLWLTDDNFFADRNWAMEVLRAIRDANFNYRFTIQARYEVGFDDEMLTLLREAGFDEIAMGIEFLEDEDFREFHKKSTREEIIRSIRNIRKHGLRVRGLFIVGADNHTEGIGEKIARFVIDHNICGVLIQSMYFVPGTPVYETHKDRLIDNDWSRCKGHVVHYPKHISPYALQKEIIHASGRIYSPGRLLSALFTKRGQERLLFVGEFFWQWSVRADLRKELPRLKRLGK